MKRIGAVRAALGAGALVFASAGAPAWAIFTPAEIAFIEKSEERMQVVFHSLRPDKGEDVRPPAGIVDLLPAMHQKKVWRDPDEGLLSEARLWQAPASLLYEFFEITRRSFPQSSGGTLSSPAFLVRHYEDNRFRFQMAVDRVYRARLGDSFGGRGRGLLAGYDLVLREMDSLITALAGGTGTGLGGQQLKEYKQAIMAIAAISDMAYDELANPPRWGVFRVAIREIDAELAKTEITPKSGGAYREGLLEGLKKRGLDPKQAEQLLKEEFEKEGGRMNAFLAVFGLSAMFGAVYLYLRLNEAQIAQWIADYRRRAEEWTMEYKKQFIAIKIEYLIGAPIAAGVLLGLATFNILYIAVLGGIGAFIGFKLPGIVLQTMREARGHKVEAQLMDSLVLMSNSLKSGLDITQAFEMVTKEMRPPIAEEYGLMTRNYQLGTPFIRALEALEDRIDSKLLSYMIKAIIIQSSVGGNLTKIFDRIVDNIREESKLQQKVVALTAQQKIQSIVVGFMPFVMFTVMFMFQPDTMIAFYSATVGKITAVFCLGWLAIGMFVTNKMGQVEV